MWIAKKKFGNYEKGDQVKEEDAKRFGSLYCAESSDASAPVSDNDTDKKPESEESNIESANDSAETNPKEKKSAESTNTASPESEKAAETKPRKQRR